MENVYQDILVSLAKANVRFVVAGGVAAVFHGVERVTMDVDISLDMEEGNIRRFLSVTKMLSLTPRAPVSDDFLLSAANREALVREKNALVFTYIHPGEPLFQLDIFSHASAFLSEVSSRLRHRGASGQNN